MSARFVAVVDIGKTNAKLVLHDLLEARDLWEERQPNVVRPGPLYPHFDVDGLWDFLLGALSRCASAHPVDAISVTTHGASVALVDEAGLVLPVLDYESPLPDELAADYDGLRPPFAETFSPRLPAGLNVGAQLFWLQRRFPVAFARARFILPYPQYWTWRLTGVAASEVTSLGCHTDLWEPAKGRASALADRMGWTSRLAPIRPAFEAIGPLDLGLAARVGLTGRAVPVHCGIHDSNASLLTHLLARPAPFSVVSTGTWVVSFAVGGSLERLAEDRDMLANVDAFGRAVPSARFMGGREFDILTDRRACEPAADDIARVLARGDIVLPTFIPGTGPFPTRTGTWSRGPGGLSAGERTAVASLYAAMMTATCLDAMGADGPTLVEGPFARNALFLDMLGAATGRAVVASIHATGTSSGAAQLARGGARGVASTAGAIPAPPPVSGLAAYAARWRTALQG